MSSIEIMWTRVFQFLNPKHWKGKRKIK
jgi:hypothetical protein